MNANDVEQLGKSCMAVGCGIWALFIFLGAAFSMIAILFGS